MIKNIVRALRLPFITASVLPFIFGSLIHRKDFNFLAFIFGLFTVACTHLSSNLINDYADSKSGADWQDKRFYGLFGGSKLIQEKIFTERFYLGMAVSFALLSVVSVILLAACLKTLSVIYFYLVIIFLGWSYSAKPLQFSYHYLGEIIIFILFGPALVMGGYFIQTGIFPDYKSLILSYPFGFLTTAILFANEVPDFPQDKKAGKFTLVSVTGTKKAFIAYAFLMACALLAIFTGVRLGYLSPVALFSFIFSFSVFRATEILKDSPDSKLRLVESSRITISVQALISIILILSVL